MKRLGLALASAAWVVACSSTPAVIPTKNMDRPTDMTFVCLGLVSGATGSPVLTGLPMQNCHVRGANDPSISPNGHRILGTFAFVANATRGELAVADMDSSRLLDLTPAAPGYGLLPIGGDPESISSSQDGCWVVTANRGTCDLTLLDPSRLLAETFAQGSVSATPATAGTDDGTNFRRVTVKTASGKTIRSATGEIAFLPSVALPSPAEQTTCRDMPAPKAVATFPGCDMVALLDFSSEDGSTTITSARITSAYYVRPDLPGGFLAADDEPVCPTDCAGIDSQDGGSESADLDAGSASDGGGSIDAGAGSASGAWRLQPLALEPDGSRVYVGSLRDTAITSFAIGTADPSNPAGLVLTNPARMDLAENAVGVSRIRLNVDPYLMTDGSPVQGQFLEGRGRFLYAFADDDSVRVVNISGAVPVECDVNVLTNDLMAGQTKNQACFPIGSARRRALARGPGLHIPTFTYPDSPPPLPLDMAFADLQPTSSDTNVHSLSGQFGFLIASNGQVYVVNLAPNGEDQTETHSFREVRDVGKSARTDLAVSIAPQRAVVISDQAFATTASFSALDGPLIKPFSVDSATTRWFGLPDPDGVISRSWDVVWEGVLPQTSRESGLVKSAGAQASTAGVLSDSGAEFCSSGVQAGDVLMFAGCATDADCQPDDQFICQPTVSGGRGVCLWRDGAKRLAFTSRPECARFTGSRMRYEIAQATPTSLVLNLKLDEVPKTSLNPCQTDSECRPDADHGQFAPDGGGAHAFECLELRPQERHCAEKCDKDSDCRAGNVCELVPGLASPLCVQAPPLDATCFPQPMTRYSVRAGNSYIVYGSSVPSLRTSTGAAGEVCHLDTTANPELVNRIPLSAPRCPDDFLAQAHPTGVDEAGNASPAVFVQDLSAQAGNNPCLYAGSHYDGDTSSTAAGSGDQRIRAFFENPQIRFVLTNLEQYAGDLLSIHFEFQYGFVPLTVQIPSSEVLLTMPTQIITGPTMTPESPIRRNPPANITYPYIYVIDQGSSRLTQESRGQVVRINPRAGSNEIATFDTALSGSTPFLLQ
jgi:hypothetical protein